MNTTQHAVYVPPRPNLGPESLGIGAPSASVTTLVAAAFVLAVLAGWAARRRLRARRKPMGRGPVIEHAARTCSTPREQVIAASEAVRLCLAQRFGAGWNARTTEEIVADSALGGLLPDPTRERLVLLLRLSDRAKFAEGSDAPFEPSPHGEDWVSFAAALASFLTAEAGASSKING